MSTWLSVVLITLASTGWNVGVIMQKRAADRLPLITMQRDRKKTLLAFLRSPLWIGGLAVTGIGWGIYVYALNYTPVSLARAITGAGYVVLALLAMAFLKYRLTLVEWIAVVTVTIGVLLIGRSEQNGGVEPARLDNFKLMLGIAATTVVCVTFYILTKPARRWIKPVVVFSVVSGVLSAAGDLLTKALLISVHSAAYLVAFMVHAPLIIIFYLTGFFALSRAYQQGSAVTAVIVSDFAVRVGAAFLGMYVLGELIPTAPALRLFRVFGFLIILFGSALLGRFSAEEPARPAAEKSQ